MNKLTCAVAVALGITVPFGASAAEKTITLTVMNMHCADCPYIVKKSLERVPGVANVTVSYKDQTAIVTYDDGKTDIGRLIAATTSAGYPSAPKS